MELDQTNELNMLNAELIILKKYISIWDGNSVVTEAFNTFKSKVDSLNAFDMAQKAKTKPITQTKTQARFSMTNLAFEHIFAGTAYATNIKNLTLKQSLKYSHSEFNKFKDVDVLAVCKSIYNSIFPLIDNLLEYGANSATIAGFQDSINTFSGMIGKPRSQKAVSVAATKSIVNVLSETRNFNKDVMDSLIEQYKLTNSDFYNEYHVSRKIVNIGHRKMTILSGIIKNSDGEPVENALVTLRGTKKKKKTGTNGAYKFVRIHPGKSFLDVTAQDYDKNTVKVNITEFETNKMDVTLKGFRG